MLRHHLTIIWRNLIKNKTHSFINISGLAIGLTCNLFILLWVQDELGVDAYHQNRDRLFKVYEREYYSDHIDGNYDTPGLLAEEIKKKIPEVEDAIMMQDVNSETTIQSGIRILKVSGTAAGAGIFSMFSYPLLQGSANNALNAPVNIAISRKTANAFFESPEKAMGQTLRFDDKKNYTVSAVFEDLPANASRSFDYLISWEARMEDRPWLRSWGNSGPLTFLLLRKNARPEMVDKKLTRFLDSYNKGQDEAYHIELGLQKFKDVYLHNHFENGKVSGGRIEYVNLFSIVAVFVLLIACINFMNLTTARSVKRAREVGVRKTLGAVRTALIKQFIIESLFLTASAVVLAVIGMRLLLPLFNTITEKQMVIPFPEITFWLQLTVITLVTGFLSGIYPAFFLSSFQAVKVLKGVARLTSGAVWFRKGLVVFQFVLSMVLIIGTIVVSRQVRFIQTRNLGYDRENLIYIPIEGELANKYEILKTSALKLSAIQSVSQMSDNPSNLDQQTNNVDWDGRDSKTLISFEHPAVAYDFVKTMKLTMSSGRDFSKDYPTDKDGVIINETAAKSIGYVNAVGRNIKLDGRNRTIIGVLRDFHFKSLQRQINPIIIEMSDPLSYGNILIRTGKGKTREALAAIETICKQLNPGFTFSYSFSDAEYQKLYRNEQIVGMLSNIFAFFAIFISCLGLLGLVMFTAEQRTKEIGIRKVLGASISGILKLISGEFLKLVFIAILIATPIAWWAMHSWLDNYAYKISLTAWMFVLAAGVAILITIITISFHTMKAARENPVESLRSE